MTKAIWLATAACLALSTTAMAQTPPQAPAEADSGQQGVLVFEPAFFAEAQPNTALDMVRRVPGFSVVDGDGSRGFEGSVGNVLVNGSRPASKNDTGSSVLGRTLASQVLRVELIRGGAPGIDMQGFSLVVNVILKSENSSQSVLTLNHWFFDGGNDPAAGSYQYTARNGDRTWGITISDGVSISDANGVGPVLRVDAFGNVIREEAYYKDQAGGGQSVRGNFGSPFMGGKIDLTARYGINDYSQFEELTGPAVLRRNEFENDGNGGEFGAVYTRPLTDGSTLESRFIHQFNTFDSVASSQTTLGGVPGAEQVFESEGESSETILRALLRQERSPTLSVEGGGEVAYNMLETNQSFAIDGVPVPLPGASVTVEETRGELFGKATWRPNDKWTVEGGLRLEASTIGQSGDSDQEKSFFFIKPRVQATWTPMENNQVRFRVEREVGQLDFGDFAASSDLSEENVLGGNADLEPEQRWIAEMVYERRFWGDGIVSVGFRHDEIDDVIDVIPLDMGLSAVGNIGSGKLDQLTVNINVPLDKTGFTGGNFGFRNTWNNTEVTDPTTGKKRPISGIRARQAVISLSQDITSWKLQWGAAWLPRMGQTSFDPDQTVAWRGRDYFEAWTEYKPMDGLSVRFQANLWDHFLITRSVYADRTTSRPIAFIETRDIDPRTFYQIQIRKTF